MFPTETWEISMTYLVNQAGNYMKSHRHGLPLCKHSWARDTDNRHHAPGFPIPNCRGPSGEETMMMSRFFSLNRCRYLSLVEATPDRPRYAWGSQYGPGKQKPAIPPQWRSRPRTSQSTSPSLPLPSEGGEHHQPPSVPDKHYTR
jgi:hypothetical protein